MPANDKLLQYFDSIDSNEDIDESTSIDDLIIDIKDEPAPKVKPRIKVNIKPVNKPKPVAVDMDDVVSEDNHPKNSNASDIDAFLAKARAEAVEKQKKQDRKQDSNPFKQTFNQTTIHDKPKITTYTIPQEDIDEEDIVHIEEDDVPSVTELVKMSETSYTDEWLEVYEKAQNSKKKNYTTDKLKSGRFRINSDHQVEILADKNTYGMSADDMLNEKWT